MASTGMGFEDLAREAANQRLGRRRVLRFGLGAILALIGWRLVTPPAGAAPPSAAAEPAAAAAANPPPFGDFLRMAASNIANLITRLTSSDSAGTFEAVSTGDGPALSGQAFTARAVVGTSVTNVGVFGYSEAHVGVVGEGGDRGVHGFSPTMVGVRAASNTGIGLAATSGSPPPSEPSPPSPAGPIAVVAESFNPGGVGVVAKGPERGLDAYSETGVGAKGESVQSAGVVAKSGQAQGLYAQSDGLNTAAVEAVATSTDLATFNTGVLGRVERGHGVQGYAATGIGVKGQSEETSGSGIGVLGDAAAGVAVKGFSRDATGIGIGVLGEALTGVALKGFVGSPGGMGAVGEAPEGTGVLGSSVAGTGVHAYSVSGWALNAQGRARFESVTVVPVNAGRNVGRLTGIPHAHTGSVGIATAQGTGLGVAVSHIAIPEDGTVEVHLTGAASAAGYVAVLILN
ncbi:MAG: hypothetical protein AMXMBFR23_07870 [Chloroflexota bacterium]